MQTVSTEYGVVQLKRHTGNKYQCALSTTSSTYLTHIHIPTEQSNVTTQALYVLSRQPAAQPFLRRSYTHGAKQFYSVVRELFYCVYRAEDSLVTVLLDCVVCLLFVGFFRPLFLSPISSLSFDYSTFRF